MHSSLEFELRYCSLCLLVQHGMIACTVQNVHAMCLKPGLQ